MDAARSGHARVYGVFYGGTSARSKAASHKPYGERQRKGHEVCRITAAKAVSARRLYRACHREQVHEELRIATLSVQGLCWSRLDNQQKIRGLIEAARRGKWHVCFLSDLHEGLTDVHTVCIEEFVLVVLSRGREGVGILSNQAAYQARLAAGAVRYTVSSSSRWLAVPLKFHGTVYVAVGAYMPTQACGAGSFFWTVVMSFGSLMPVGAPKICGGDWKSHFGKEAEVLWSYGKKGLSTPTAQRSWGLSHWACDHGLQHVDSHIATKSRGTWFNMAISGTTKTTIS
mmetsp:Transcript_22118/g.43107  ORF Transcript_22118/g.43107 Transcript_22118/m.43107 type:complete len:286 (+) Transcript_22118:189-1046(+)